MFVFLQRRVPRRARPARLSMRRTRPIVRPGTTFVINSFSPLTTKSSPSPRHHMRSAVRSEPAFGSVGAKADNRWPLARPGRNRWLSAPPSRTSAPDRPRRCNRAQLAMPATVGSIVAMRVRNGAKLLKRSAGATVFAVHEQTPIAGRSLSRRMPRPRFFVDR